MTNERKRTKDEAKASDFIPIYGVVKYLQRGADARHENRGYSILLAAYHGAAVPLAAGLVALLCN